MAMYSVMAGQGWRGDRGSGGGELELNALEKREKRKRGRGRWRNFQVFICYGVHRDTEMFENDHASAQSHILNDNALQEPPIQGLDVTNGN